MKKILFVCLLFAASQVFAQSDETIFGDVDRIGAFGGPIFEFSNFDGETTTAVGGGGALILDDFFLGGYGIGGIDFADIDFNSNLYELRGLDFGHGGLWFGYTPFQNKSVHPIASAKFGWGKIEYALADISNPSNIVELDKQSDRIFAVTPEVGIELNVFSFFRVAVTANYRWVNGVDQLDELQDSDFSEFGGTLTLKFGGFGNSW